MKDARKPSVPKEPSNDAGGRGESASDSALSARKDLRLTARALAESWPVPAALRTKVVKSLETVLTDPEASPRDIASASKALIAASRINLQAVAVGIAADDHEAVKDRLDAVEQALEKDKGRRR